MGLEGSLAAVFVRRERERWPGKSLWKSRLGNIPFVECYVNLEMRIVLLVIVYSSFFIFLSSNGIILDIKFEEKLLSYYYHSDWRVFFVGIFIYSFSL